MNTLVVEWIGTVAAVLSTGSFLPQVYQTWKTKSTESLSLPMLLLFFMGVCLWMIYGFFIQSIPLLISNIITTICAGFLLFYKLKYK